jgi:hypothetical protein
MIARISENLDVPTVLRNLGIEPPARGRMRCPIHGGDGLNFAILPDGRSWCCHSHGCGAGHRRDSITLYCLIKFGRAFRDLDSVTKGEALRQLADLAGVTLDGPKPNRSRNRFDRDLPLADRTKLAELFADTSLIDGPHGRADAYESRTAQRTILFLAVAKSLGELPESISHVWLESQNFGGFLNGET